jgi:hypothetical protein
MPRVDTSSGVECVARLAHSIDAARSRLWIKVPWIRTDGKSPETLVAALEAAAGRGVDVRVLLRPEASNEAVIGRLYSAGAPHRMVRYLLSKGGGRGVRSRLSDADRQPRLRANPSRGPAKRPAHALAPQKGRVFARHHIEQGRARGNHGFGSRAADGHVQPVG